MAGWCRVNGYTHLVEFEVRGIETVLFFALALIFESRRKDPEFRKAPTSKVYEIAS
jgi:hypothetical protein